MRALVALRAERAARRDKQGNVRMAAQKAGRSGKLVIEADNISVGYPGKPPLIREFSTIIQRGDRVGLIGENGTGKTSLIRVLLGEQEPTEGAVRLGTNLEVSYFDQLRETLDPEASVMHNVAEGQRCGDSGRQQPPCGRIFTGFSLHARPSAPAGQGALWRQA